MWLGDSLARLRASSADIRADAGYQLDLVQRRYRFGQAKVCRAAGIETSEDMKSTNSTNMIKGSGDLFADLGFSPTEARNLRLRTQMMTALRKFIEKEGLTQVDAAKLLKVSQPRVSDLICGKISRFSLDALVNLLSDAGLEVDFKIKPHSHHPIPRITPRNRGLRA
jgi:predicted XRE-type DNA-binding protein